MIETPLWTLLAIQVFLGGFDTVYHHEITERLAWRASQQHELKLHGVRNILYAVLFLILGFAQLTGWLAYALSGLLVVELFITLKDFVEEDRTRNLPATERVTHTLLTLNYGAILVLLAPVLLEWARQPAAATFIFHGVWSILCLPAALGVCLFGFRDLHAAARLQRIRVTPAADLMTALPERRRILVTGGTGFIGTRLTTALIAAGHAVTILTRDVKNTQHLTPPFTVVTNTTQIAASEKFDAIINLAGEPIANGLWTARKRQQIIESRVCATKDIVALIDRLHSKPAVLVNGSAIGWYGCREDEPLTEAAAAAPGFTHDVCAAWERTARQVETLGVRVVLLRIGLVLGSEGGMLANLLFPFEFGLGGRIGSGRQWMSWIARDDLVRLIAHCIATPALRDAVNATAPHPVRNADFTRTLGKCLTRPALLPLPALPLRVLAGDFAEELLLGGQYVLPHKASASGFHFTTPHLDQALDAIVGNAPPVRPLPLSLTSAVPGLQ
jgi:uncharacterized protein